jgi:OPT family oligopeptide transporter
MFGAIFGYGIIMLLTKAFPMIPFLGGRFGPQENSIVQASATGAGGLAGLFVAGLPAMYKLGLLSDNPKADFGRILTITFVCAFFGLFAAVPLRKFFVINVARELNLVFPSPTATAVAIRSMHAVSSGANDAMKKVKALFYAFLGAFTHIIVAQYADGILHNWHMFSWFYAWSGYTNWAQNIDNWGWYIQLTPAFFGSGILVGLNTALSWFGGTIAAYGIIGPLLIHYGECVGTRPYLNSDDVPPLVQDRWGVIAGFGKMSGIKDAEKYSPRYWMLWPGVMVLVVYSLIEFFIHIRVLYDGLVFAMREMAVSLDAKLKKRGKSSAFLEKQAAKVNDATVLVEDFAPPDQQVPVWVWLPGAFVFLIVAMIVCHFQFHMNAGLAILACLLGILFAFMSIYGGAVTDVTPLTASSKASQLIFGGITRGHDVQSAQRINLIAGNIASGTADVATSLVSDFRVGFLLKTPPKLQFYAQAMGAVVSVFLAPGVFVLFMSAYPCVWKPDWEKTRKPGEQCPFAAPSVEAWKAVAEAVTLPELPIPASSGYFAIAMGIVCALQALFKNFYLVGERQKYRAYLPNYMAVGVAWVLGPDSGYANAVLFGSITAWWWKKYFNKSFDNYAFAIAAGLIAGEGLAGVVNAALTLAKVDGGEKGSTIALPGYIW